MEFTYPTGKPPKRAPRYVHSNENKWGHVDNISLDILLAKLILADVRENIYIALQRILKLKNLNKRKQYNDPIMQYLEVNTGKGLSLVGYEALLMDSNRKLPPELTALIPEKLEDEAEKKKYLAQYLSGSNLCKNLKTACDRHYETVAPNRIPLYMRKPKQ